jgi:hypothetical protein
MTLMTGHCWHEEIMPRIKRGTDPLGTAPAYRQPSGTERHSWPEFPPSFSLRDFPQVQHTGGSNELVDKGRDAITSVPQHLGLEV